MSSKAIETPDFVAYSKPRYINLSAKITAAFKPTSLYVLLMSLDISLLSIVLFISENGIS